jgi:prophage maintenance system killer protein
MAKSHMCWTGVKRVTAALTLTMLELSGCWLKATADELEDVITRCASSDPGEKGVTLQWLQAWARSVLACA